jgi:hypothetical protein
MDFVLFYPCSSVFIRGHELGKLLSVTQDFRCDLDEGLVQIRRSRCVNIQAFQLFGIVDRAGCIVGNALHQGRLDIGAKADRVDNSVDIRVQVAIADSLAHIIGSCHSRVHNVGCVTNIELPCIGMTSGESVHSDEVIRARSAGPYIVVGDVGDVVLRLLKPLWFVSFSTLRLLFLRRPYYKI